VTFLDLVNAELMPAIAPLGFVIVHNQVSVSFGDALVEVEAPTLRLRAIRDRSQVFVDFGPVSERATWFDSDLVLEHLGPMSSTSHRSRDATTVLRATATFLTSFREELETLLDAHHLPDTKREMEMLGERRAAKEFRS
jgi:hypothetical protein